MANIFQRPEGDYPLYFRVGSSVYRLRFRAGFELQTDGSWRHVVLSEQDYNQLREVSAEAAAA